VQSDARTAGEKTAWGFCTEGDGERRGVSPERVLDDYAGSSDLAGTAVGQEATSELVV
jgi:hypothetical protein